LSFRCIQRVDLLSGPSRAQNSRLGNGVRSPHARSIRAGQPRPSCGLRREIFLALGGYDETFTHNETRNSTSGWCNRAAAYLDAEAIVTYYPRSNFVSLARQYFNHGSGRRARSSSMGLPGGRQMLPVAALLACLLSLGLAVANPAFSAVAILYALACTTWGLALAIQQRQICAA
jgi:succinoglycan biosynthesis protein ExoA